MQIHATIFTILLGISFIISSCSPKIQSNIVHRYPPLPAGERVLILTKNDSLPQQAEKLGTIRVGEKGMTVNCSLPEVLAIVRKEAGKMGGNMLRITSHKLPDVLSSCHRITADIFRVESDGKTDLASEMLVQNRRKRKESGQEGEPTRSVLVNQAYQKWRMSGCLGYSRRTAKVSEQVAPAFLSYVKALKSGMVLGGDVHYFYGQNAGIGIKYNYEWFRNDIGSDFYDHISMHYLAGSWISRTELGGTKNVLVFGMNAGLQTYRNKALEYRNSYKINGSTLGMGLEAGFEHHAGKNTHLILNLSYMMGTLRKVKWTEAGVVQTISLSKEKLEGLGRLNVTLGLSFGSKK